MICWFYVRDVGYNTLLPNADFFEKKIKCLSTGLSLATNHFSVRKTTMQFFANSCLRLIFPTEPRLGSFFGAFSNADGHSLTYLNI